MQNCTLSPSLTKVVNDYKHRNVTHRKLVLASLINKALEKLEEAYQQDLEKEKISLCNAIF